MNDRHKKNGSVSAADELPAELLTAYALGQLDEAERAGVERRLGETMHTEAQSEVEATRRLAARLREAMQADLPVHKPSPALREAVIARLENTEPSRQEPVMKATNPRQMFGLSRVQWSLVGGLACLLAVIAVPAIMGAFNSGRRVSSAGPQALPQGIEGTTAIEQKSVVRNHAVYGAVATSPESAAPDEALPRILFEDGHQATASSGLLPGTPAYKPWIEQQVAGTDSSGDGTITSLETAISPASEPRGTTVQLPATDPAGLQPSPTPKPTTGMSLAGKSPGGTTAAQFGGGVRGRSESLAKGAPISAGDSRQLAVQPNVTELTDGGLVEGEGRQTAKALAQLHSLDAFGREQYAAISDNPFVSPLAQPLSTFSIDVDTASYANMRRFLNGGSLPPADAVRIEELVNYFRYDYPQPQEGEAFSVNMETAECPWHNGHLLLRVGLKGKDVERTKRPPSNLVFLLDVSGSMADEDKLPLLKSSMEMLTRELGEDDRVSIVTYAGEAGLRLPPTRGHEPEKIIAAIQSLAAGGSTNGSAGIEIAYEQAAAYFVKGGTNRVILCTDGDLNVGITDDEALVELIKKKAAGGTFLTVLGFGQGNLKDAKMERLADNGNGLYAYIDSVREARKVLVEQLTGSTITIAKDVKIQIEFNPAQIASYRLIGYENRVLAAQDFNDDTKDAGEIGAGHTVTALYELVPVGAEKAAPMAPPVGVDPLKYQKAGEQKENETVIVAETAQTKLTEAAQTGELLTLKLRYKEPDGSESKLLEHPLKERGGRFNAASKDLQFAASVASFGMLLRGSEHCGTGNVAAVIEIAAGSLGEDAGGYRAEFVDLVRKAQSLGAK